MLKFVIFGLLFAFMADTADAIARIVGGRTTTIGRHPHQVSLRLRDCIQCSYAHNCGGSIYNEHVIITAAHCVYKLQASGLMVVAGTDIRSGSDGAIVPVQQIVLHEHFDMPTIDNDVALLFLSTPLPINNVSIAAVPLASNQPKTGTRGLVTGWGTTSENGFQAIQLLEVEVPVVSKKVCVESYGEGRITEGMLCAGIINGGGKDACKGDSGGPMLVDGELAGIVSWGRGCGRPDFPSVYANVAYYKDWIEKTVKA